MRGRINISQCYYIQGMNAGIWLALVCLLTRAPNLNWILKTNVSVLSHHFLSQFSFSSWSKSSWTTSQGDWLLKKIDWFSTDDYFRVRLPPMDNCFNLEKNLLNSLFQRSNEWLSSRNRSGYTSYLNSLTLSIISDSLCRMCLVINPDKYICAQAMLITLSF